MNSGPKPRKTPPIAHHDPTELRLQTPKPKAEPSAHYPETLMDSVLKPQTNPEGKKPKQTPET